MFEEDRQVRQPRKVLTETKHELRQSPGCIVRIKLRLADLLYKTRYQTFPSFIMTDNKVVTKRAKNNKYRKTIIFESSL